LILMFQWVYELLIRLPLLH